MKKNIISFVLAAILGIGLLTGCSDDEEAKTEETRKPDTELTTKELSDGNYYIRHKDGKFTELYTGKASFDTSGGASEASDDRVFWYKKDFKYIPTLYTGKGDTLVYYSKNNFDENFKFERFYDLGYSVGICKMTIKDSGRYSISTDKEENTTYPGGDTDKLLSMGDDENGSVVIDAVAGQLLRATKASDESDSFEDSKYVTQWKTIKGLKEGAYYNFSIYKGTVRKNFKFRANVRILGSAEYMESADYVYDKNNQKIINIGIPNNFHSGYYYVNSGGVFRYVVGSQYNESTSFNEPNEYPEDSDKQVDTSVTGYDEDDDDESDLDDDDEVDMENDSPYSMQDGSGANYDKVVDFTPNSSGVATFTITLSGVYDESAAENFTAAVILNDGDRQAFSYNGLDDDTATYTTTLSVTQGSALQIGYSRVPSGATESITYSIS